MSTDYRNNHCVPQWYQKRFIPQGQVNNELFYFDLDPSAFTDSRGVAHPKKSVHNQGLRLCFCEDDLYTTWFGSIRQTSIEQIFFKQIDENGRNAVDFFADAWRSK